MSTDEVPAGAGAPPDAFLFPWTLAHLQRGAGPSLAPSLRLSTDELRAGVRAPPPTQLLHCIHSLLAHALGHGRLAGRPMAGRPWVERRAAHHLVDIWLEPISWEAQGTLWGSLATLPPLGGSAGETQSRQL